MKLPKLSLFAALPAACFLAGVAACTPKVDNTGYVTGTPISGQISPGQSREDVVSRIGSPSSQSSFGTEAWYYVTSRKESWAFLPYEVAKQDVTRIEFDETGHVTKVQAYDLSNSEDIALVKRETETEGHSLGFFEQILGNIGRFNSPGGGAGGTAPGNNRSSIPGGR